MVMQTAAYRAALARSAVYDFLSLAFLYPREELLAAMKALAKGLQWESEAAEAFESLRPVLSTLSPAEWESQYAQVLGHTLSPECPPYEAEYGGGHDEADIFRKVQKLADIAGFYRAWGLEISEQANERPDHIAIELEFMSYLACKEAYAYGVGLGEEKIELCRASQRRFLREHLGWWGPPFTRSLERRSSEAGSDFYEKLARLTRAWLAHELATLGVTPPTKEASLHVQKEEPVCDTCPLAST